MNVAFFAFFYVLKKRLQKNASFFWGLISRQKLEKRMQKHVAFFKRTQKNDAFRTQKNAVPNPAMAGMVKVFRSPASAQT